MEDLEVFVPGVPMPKGSHRAFVVKQRAIVTDSNAKKLKPWQGLITTCVRERYQEAPYDGPVVLQIQFYMPPPKSLAKTKPHYATKRPDLDKLTRTVKDALTQVVYRDDSQVVACQISKQYSATPGVLIQVSADVPLRFVYYPAYSNAP